MNYFQIFDIEERIDVDLAELKKSFYRLSREHHPDMHTLSAEGEKEDNLIKSTEINQAYRTLKDRDQRIKYILTELGELSLNEGEALDPMFLMEMMELNEKAEDIRDPHEKQEMRKQIDETDREAFSNLSDLHAKDIGEYDEQDWSRLKKYYLERRYLLRLIKNFE